ncbi:ATP-dependent helicase C-terminal-domain-containing protein [Dunaliella salina]|uniref:ATP-dependent helicase C-terminal-domain-containing protein n=1 Tax=Dunaliella salina TaxID=3046 RepID=A0ABQ7H6T8_DUNSA|nr:ATP-dependent helicase C-terminal-domain-containing protein [Dunaliella salina]|eukprot:KAF5842574.1 ATP-dependent helicase C-terminal-domain-containing protein [Dunaliella salina]
MMRPPHTGLHGQQLQTNPIHLQFLKAHHVHSIGKTRRSSQNFGTPATLVQKKVELSPVLEPIVGDLPIREVLPRCLTALDQSSNMVLQAPPGAGKTTTLPLALLLHDPDYLSGNKKILVLEPRIVAAKSAARRMASLLAEPVGGRVGYRVRLDSRVSAATRVEVVTEGVLLRRLQTDPELSGVGAILFDEFHERNLDADCALALCLDLQAIGRPDLHLAVMSATLGGGLAERLASLMAAQPSAESASAMGASSSVPCISSQGRSFPVKTTYLGAPPLKERWGVERAAAEAAQKACAAAAKGSHGKDGAGPADVLVFLPGLPEIRQTARLLAKESRLESVEVVEMHGSLAPAEQDAVVKRRTSSRQRIILSTPIAESSVTIEGVAAADQELIRSVAERAKGMLVWHTRMHLEDRHLCQSSADQRRGRAGRTGPGLCFRLWDESTALEEATTPEIMEADLAPLSLQLAKWGVNLHAAAAESDAAAAGSGMGSGSVCVVGRLRWLDAPPAARLTAAADLLQGLGAIDDKSRITPEGNTMSRMPLHPRFAHMVLQAQKFGATELAAVLGSMLSERDLLKSGGSTASSASLLLRLACLAYAAGGNAGDIAGGSSLAAGLGVPMSEVAAMADRGIVRRVLLGARQLMSAVPSAGGGDDDEDAEASSHAGQTANAFDLPQVDGDKVGFGDSLEQQEGLESGEEWASASTSGDGTAEESKEVAPVRQGGGTAERRTSSGSSSSSSKDFDAAWRLQAGRDGLVGALVAFAYPDRLAIRRGGVGTKSVSFAMSGGSNVRLLSDRDPLGQTAEFLAIAELQGSRDSSSNDIVRQGAPLSAGAVDRFLKGLVRESKAVFWASGSKAVLGRQRKCLGSLVLEEKAVPVSDDEALPALFQGFREMGGISNVGLPADVEAWRQRVIWLRQQDLKAASESQLPDLSDQTLNLTVSRWLAPHLIGCRSKSDCIKLPWGYIIKALVPSEQMRRIDAEAPACIQLPTGTRAPIDYSREPPVIRAKIQEVFGLLETPTLAGGSIPIVFELLSPAQRPLQTTADLAGFWKTSYQAVRREQKGRYPKHYWPEDPSVAEPTKLTKKGLEQAALQKSQSKALDEGVKKKVGKGKGKGR